MQRKRILRGSLIVRSLSQGCAGAFSFQRTTPAGRENLLGPGGIFLDFGDLGETGLGAFEEPFVEYRLRTDEGIMDPIPGSSHGDEAGIAKVLQMPRDGRLGRPEYFDEISHAHLVL